MANFFLYFVYLVLVCVFGCLANSKKNQYPSYLNNNTWIIEICLNKKIFCKQIRMLLIPCINKMNKHSLHTTTTTTTNSLLISSQQHHHHHHHNRIMNGHSTPKTLLWTLSLICSKLITFKLLIIHFIFNFGKWKRFFDL